MSKKESATIILIRTVGKSCTRINRQEAGVPPYHLNKYGPRLIIGYLLSKERFKISTLYDNIDELTAPDRKIVTKYANDEKLSKSWGHYIESRFFLPEKDYIKTDIKKQGRKYLKKNHDLINKLRGLSYKFATLEMKYDLTFVVLPFYDRWIILLLSKIKHYEFRLNRLRGTIKGQQNRIKEMSGNSNFNANKSKKNDASFISKELSKHESKHRKITIQEILDYIENIQKNMHLLIVERAEKDSNYHPMRDCEILHYGRHMQQWKVDIFKLLSAKPLHLKKGQYKGNYYQKILKPKPWDQLRAEYCPGEAASTS